MSMFLISITHLENRAVFCHYRRLAKESTAPFKIKTLVSSFEYKQFTLLLQVSRIIAYYVLNDSNDFVECKDYR